MGKPKSVALLTAEEARKLSGSTPEEAVERLLKRVRELASMGRREIRTGYDHPSDSEIWSKGGYDESSKWQEAKKLLESLGYTVEFYYRELQFVDMYTIVKW